jgi:hypothetical protein
VRVPNVRVAESEGDCPVCAGRWTLFDVVDFHKSCLEERRQFVPLCGVPIYYARCQGCGFIFSPQMHRWTDADFAENVYNEQYVIVDPDFVEIRPMGFAEMIYKSFGDRAELIKHLDFGGGSGLLSATLRNRGMDSVTYDPFHGDHASLPDGKFNFISAFEVFEHASQIDRLMTQLAGLAADDCAIIFSTLLSDGRVNEVQRLQWWYAAPRNGHVSLWSRRSLKILGQRWGFEFGSFGAFNGNLHAFWRGRPEWALFIDQLAAAD